MTALFEKMRRGLRNPRLIHGKVREYGAKANALYYQRVGKRSGADFMTEDWDVLILLDACRYDAFKRHNELDGTLESRRSPGSTSWEFMENTYQGRTLHDCVYVTGNPHFHWLEDGIFHEIIDCLETGWDEELGTVPPGTMTDIATEAVAEYPNKRHIVHYMQPHYPFLGETGRELEHRGFSRTPGDVEEADIWTLMRKGYVDEERVWQAYRENLDLVLDAVGDLLDEIEGRIVISADHGSLIGDRLWPVPVRGYGHPPGIYVSEVMDVPWFVMEQGTRPEIEAETPQESGELEDSMVEQRLADLGYK